MRRIVVRRLCAVAVAVSCAAALSACGSSGNPVIDSPGFVSTCISKVQANQRSGASINATDYCQCYQQKLDSVGLGGQTLGQASHDSQAAVAVSICGPNLLGGSTPTTTI